MSEKKIFDTERLIPTYFKMALPVVFGLVITLIYNLADTYFIAKTNDAMLVAGVSLCAPIFMVLMAIGNIFGQGGSSLIARLLGKNDVNSVRRVSAFCFYLSILTGAVIAIPMLLLRKPMLDLLGASPNTVSHAESYYTVIVAGAPLVILSFIHTNLMRSEGKSTQSMICTVSGSVLNIILDPIFISGFGWGAWGAALATVMGYALTDLLCLFFVLKKCRALSVKVRESRVDRNEFSQIFSIGFTAALSNIASSVCLVFMNQYLRPLPDGDDKIAALGIVMKVSMIVNMILVGFAFGGVPLFGFLIGSGEREKQKKLLRFCLCFLSALALTMSAAVILAARPLLSLITPDEALRQTAVPMLRWQAAGSVFAGMVMLLTCLFQASGKAAYAMTLSLSRQGIVFVAVLLVMVGLAGYQGILVTQLIADGVSAMLALGLFALYSRGSGETPQAARP